MRLSKADLRPLRAHVRAAMEDAARLIVPALGLSQAEYDNLTKRGATPTTPKPIVLGLVELPKGEHLPQGVVRKLKAKVIAFDVALKAQGIANAARRLMCRDLFNTLRAHAEQQARVERIKRRAKKAGETRSMKALNRCRAKGEHATEAPLAAFAPAKGPHHKPKAHAFGGPEVKVRKKSS